MVILFLFEACNNDTSDDDDDIIISTESLFITSDIDLFWSVYDTIDPLFQSSNFQSLYIDKGTVGLKDYAAQKNLATSLENVLNIDAYNEYYKSIRNNTLDLTNAIEKSKVGFNTLEEIYSNTRLFDVYFLIGALTAGGRVSSNGLLIATEMFAKSENTSLNGLSEWHQSVILSKEYLPSIIIHELIHKQQHFSPENNEYATLLEQSVREGMADYFALYIFPDEPFMNAHLHSFADTIEMQLWNEFKIEMDLYYKETEWLYTGSTTSNGYPADLGYFIGFKIVESYVNTFENIQSATLAIFSNPNYYDIYNNSGYEKKFK